MIQLGYIIVPGKIQVYKLFFPSGEISFLMQGLGASVRSLVVYCTFTKSRDIIAESEELFKGDVP